jgi:hypothetical protein
MQEAIDGFLVMPGWAQAGVSLFALTFLAMLVMPGVENRRHRKRFAALAEARGVRAVRGPDEFSDSFSLEHAGRPFTVRREMRSSSRGSSYRGPRGHLVVVETSLSGGRWKMHGVDVAQRGALARMLGVAAFRSGDAVFDERFTVWQDGVPVRDGWLDAPTRAAFTAFFDLPSVGREGTVWVLEGVLQYINDTPAKLDAAGLSAIVERQAALAAALETTAGWRGPAS